MEHELRKFGCHIMEQLYKEYTDLVDEGCDPDDSAYNVLDNMNSIEMLAVIYATCTTSDAFASVIDEIAECVSNRNWAFQ